MTKRDMNGSQWLVAMISRDNRPGSLAAEMAQGGGTNPPCQHAVRRIEQASKWAKGTKILPLLKPLALVELEGGSDSGTDWLQPIWWTAYLIFFLW